MKVAHGTLETRRNVVEKIRSGLHGEGVEGIGDEVVYQFDN